MKLIASTFVVFMACCLASAAQIKGQNSVLIDRKSRSLSIVNQAGRILLSCPIGVGRGPLKEKSSMQDCITPTGSFTVDVVLTDTPALNQIDQSTKEQIERNTLFRPFVKNGEGLARVFRTMNEQDFNRDGTPDKAYGRAFLGLQGKNTGPKLIAAGKSARWYSIALHGTPNEAKAIGGATSEGCIHLSSAALKKILDAHLIGVGTAVYINDGIGDVDLVKRKSFVDDNQEQVRMRN
ncbi:MAG: hypothetical protein DKT66_20840 [Candidatus Melainabacteria bacterium]|nr:MAG: hypothetical protein DKT66_20840 [Candidatus Melainabacteria bacterium]